MKQKINKMLILTLIIIVASGGLYGQTKQEEEKKKEEMVEKKKQQEEEIQFFLQDDMQKRGSVILRKNEIEKAIREAREAYPNVNKVDNYGYVSAGNAPGIYFVGGSNVSSSLQYSKTVKEASFKRDLDFEIEENAKHASIQVSGICKEGEIRILIDMPSGKTYTEILIDEYGSVNWSKSFSIDGDNESKSGEWVFHITASNATGNFRLSLKSY